jgi:hypothetical protein
LQKAEYDAWLQAQQQAYYDEALKAECEAEQVATAKQGDQA